MAVPCSLFISLVIGLFFSTLARDPKNASTATFLLVILTYYLLPMLPTIPLGSHWSGIFNAFNWLSPRPPFVHAMEAGYGRGTAGFLVPLLVSNLFGWTLLIAPNLALPRV